MEPKQTLDLTLEQQLSMIQYEQNVQKLTREELMDLVLQCCRLTMLKDNVILNLMSKGSPF